MNKNEETLMYPVAEFLMKAEELIEAYSNELDSTVSPSLHMYKDPINRVIRTLESFLQDEMLDDFFAGEFTPESLNEVKKQSEFGV